MSGNLIKNVLKRLRYRSVEFDLKPYMNILEQINKTDFSRYDGLSLKMASADLMRQARNGVPLHELLVKAYALVREASWRVLKMRHFDVQVIAGIVMHFGKLAEMQTGEGKTLAAVLPAYLNALTGKGVHVLTFNDYLAKRDAEWMGPVYEFLGLTVGYIREGMTPDERKKAYSADITYLTAKEAGFDYLKGFLCMDKNDIVQRPFNFAIIDEADSILIDEARIPLVIAGKTQESATDPMRMAEIVEMLEPHVDYETDEYERNVYLTDKGLSRVERILKCGNLYDGTNTKLLADLNNALHAKVLLKRDVDYIVRNGKVELVDEFTGRVAYKRHWPHGLQEAVEAKEGIVPEEKGQIMASITLQNFIRLYPRICGMTGTALTAADEFLEFYKLRVVVIPTNRPCIRVDYPDVIFTHKEAKHKALIAEISKVHKTGRPILIGTCSVEESEQLTEELKNAGIDCQVLNAKNDELEAKIIAKAGELYAVTVSTNMAGRGTDIKLGGESGQDKDKIIELGGLYVIGTNRHESRRIDNQLRGRSGRQGDPGSSKFFISLEDDLFMRYKLKELIPAALYPKEQMGEIDNKVIRREIARAQRIVEGQNFEIRKTLTKYSIVLEQQWRMIYNWRQNILFDYTRPCLMPVKLSERYKKLLPVVGEEALIKAEKQVTLYFINKCWADYLDYLSFVRETIYLVNMAGKVPLDEYNKIAIESFNKLIKEIEDEVIGVLSRAEINENGIDMKKEGLHAPSSTWTYLINDSPEQLGINNKVILNPFASIFMWPLMIAGAVYKRFSRKSKHVK
ncbi:MAG TPA: accessory Sec system translocase SecA2 [Clostridiaceae bacterium]|nr:accessory Sec system translocase SecA2 [Clostridiaceae bacterium]